MRDSRVPSKGPITDEEPSDMTSKQSKSSYGRHRSDSDHNQKWKFGVMNMNEIPERSVAQEV